MTLFWISSETHLVSEVGKVSQIAKDERESKRRSWKGRPPWHPVVARCRHRDQPSP
ncbi:nucleoside deaminase [Sesbania bispinosa]|nr:nucleoside deaminase [Sesbania bispinosa]